MTCPGVKLEKFLLPLFVFLMNKKCQGVLIWMWWGIIYISLKKKKNLKLEQNQILISIFCNSLKRGIFVAYNFENPNIYQSVCI